MSSQTTFDTADPQWAVFISGRGSTLRRLLELRLNVRVVLASKAGTMGGLRASLANVPVLTLPKPIDWTDVQTDLETYGVTHIFLAGFMHIIPEIFLKRWQNRIFNIHPSLLPAYPGLKSIERSHADGAAMGATIHHVIPQVDAGQIILQKQSSSPVETQSLSFDEAEFRLHVCEQHLLDEWWGQWGTQDLQARGDKWI